MTVSARIHGGQAAGRKTDSTPVTHHRRRSASTGSFELSPVEKQAQKECFMFTRVVEVTTKPGKAKELSNTINDKVLPILKKQVGFVDETVLASDTDLDRVLAISFWNTKEDAERYNRDQYPAIHEIMRPLLDADPVVRTFNVDSSTTHKIAATKAA
jgi:heme-degrading monooxygenase HmoA